ncbi:thioredoxin-like domain-containing protein [Chryseobacterium taichungense]|uniref:thioredoxin-like domain-containing protein n=1 Tax=Chryseobacterium taichungense TaxID=295069 RepID=UPI0028A5F642|nr:thioredoxin-like domain-containing protein [Chryseobacterium taichungense]
MKNSIKQKTYTISTILLLIIFHITGNRLAAQDRMIKIQGTVTDLKDGDSVMLIRYNYQFIAAGLENQIISYATVSNHRFSFTTELSENIERCRIIFPQRLAHLDWKNGILEPGNDLDITLKNNQLVFSKEGAAIVNYNNCLDSIYKANIAGIDWQGKEMQKNRKIITTALKAIQNADRNNDRYDHTAFSTVRLEKSISLVTLLYSIANINKGLAKDYIRKIDTHLRNTYIKDFLNNKDLINVPSASWIGLVTSRYECIFNKNYNGVTKLHKDSNYLQYLKTNFKGQILSQLIAAFLYYNRQSDTLTIDYVDSITKGIDFSRYKNLVQGIQRFSPGTELPEFSLTDTLGNQVPLSRFKGNVLVLDFWFTGCGACAIAYKIVNPIMKMLEGKPIKFISVSRDQIPNLWLKSIRGGLYTDTTHINLSAGKQGDSHPLFRYFQVSGYPTIIIIGKNGKIIGSPRPVASDQGLDFKNKIEKALNEGH